MQNIRKAAANIRKIYWVRMLFWTHFVSSVMVPFFLEWGKLRFAQILFLNAWFMLWMFIFEVPTGGIADVFGRKRSILLGCLITMVGIVTYVSVPNFYVFLLAELILACGYTLLSGAEEAIVYDTLRTLEKADTSKAVFARMEAFKLYGIILGALAGGVIAKYLGLRMPLFLHIVPLMVCTVVAFQLKEPLIHVQQNRLGFMQTVHRGWQQFRQDKVLRVLALDMVLINSLAWLIIWFYQILLKNVGVDIIWFGIVHTLMCLSQVVIIENINRWERWLGGKRRLLILMPLAAGGCFIILGMVHNVLVVATAIVVCSAFGLSRTPLFTNYMNKYISSETRATTLSMVSMLRTLGIFIINLLAGFLADWSIPKTMVMVGIGMILLTFFSGVREEHLLD